MILVGVTVEVVRYQLHPELFNLFTAPYHPYLLSGAALAATLVLDAWTTPPSVGKGAVVAFFTQASMPTVLLIGWKLLQQIGASAWEFSREALMRLTNVG